MFPNDGNYQKWHVEDAGHGYFHVVNYQTGMRLDSNAN